jgi:hypothetical protein
MEAVILIKALLSFVKGKTLSAFSIYFAFGAILLTSCGIIAFYWSIHSACKIILQKTKIKFK